MNNDDKDIIEVLDITHEMLDFIDCNLCNNSLIRSKPELFKLARAVFMSVDDLYEALDDYAGEWIDC